MTATSLLKPFAVPPRAAIEFCVVVAALIVADPTRISLAVGGVVSLVGILMRIWASGYGYNIGDLTVKGPYRFVRHPYLLGSGILFLGICVASRQALVTGLCVFALLAAYRFVAQHDERRLARTLGPRFQNFRDRVPAFIPAVFPEMGLPADGHTFSLGLSLFRGRHRELNTLLWASAVFGLLFLCSEMTDKTWFRLLALGVALVVVTVRLWFVKSRRRLGLA